MDTELDDQYRTDPSFGHTTYQSHVKDVIFVQDDFKGITARHSRENGIILIVAAEHILIKCGSAARCSPVSARVEVALMEEQRELCRIFHSALHPSVLVFEIFWWLWNYFV